MNELTKEQQIFFNKLRAEWANQDVRYLYGLTHEMNIEPKYLFVYTNLTPQAMCGLIAYIEFVTFDITSACSYTLSEEEFIEIINQFYIPVSVIKNTPCKEFNEIDLYWNWNYHSSFSYEQGMPEWKREGLLDYVKEMAIRYHWKSS